jgi:hypothetical protein
MKLVLYFCVLILGQSAFAGSSGGFDDDDVPAARPSKPAAAKPAPASAPARSYPQCSENKWTSNAEVAQDMFEKVLKFDENFPIRLAEDKPCTGYSCAKVVINRDRSGTLVLSIVASSSASSPSKICQTGSRLQATVDTSFGQQTLVISRKNERQVDVKIVGHKEYDNSYTVGAK